MRSITNHRWKKIIYFRVLLKQSKRIKVEKKTNHIYIKKKKKKKKKGQHSYNVRTVCIALMFIIIKLLAKSGNELMFVCDAHWISSSLSPPPSPFITRATTVLWALNKSKWFLKNQNLRSRQRVFKIRSIGKDKREKRIDASQDF